LKAIKKRQVAMNLALWFWLTTVVFYERVIAGNLCLLARAIIPLVRLASMLAISSAVLLFGAQNAFKHTARGGVVVADVLDHF